MTKWFYLFIYFLLTQKHIYNGHINKMIKTKTKLHIAITRCKATNNTWDKIKRGTIAKLVDYKWFKKRKVIFFLIYFLDYWLKRGHLNRSVHIRYSIVAFNLSLLTVKLQLGLPYRKVWINWSSLWDKICSLIFLLFKRVCLGVWKFGQWRKKVCCCFSIITTVT